MPSMRRFLYFFLLYFISLNLIALHFSSSAWAGDTPPTTGNSASTSTTINTNVPKNITVDPAPGLTIKEARPSIVVTFSPSTSIRYELSRMWVNNSEVSSNCLKTPAFISYRPFTDYHDGPVEVKVRLTDASNATNEFSWSFTIKRPSSIESVHITSRLDLGAFEDLNVELKGIKGADKAWFEIEDYRFDIPLIEDKQTPGLYKGYYRIKHGDSRLRARVVGYLQKDNRTFEMTAPETASIWGQLFQVVILEPKDKSQVPLNFKIKGRTLPNCNISIVPKIGFSDNIEPATRNTEEDVIGSIPCTSDTEGYFETDYGFLVKLPGMQAVFTIIATDGKGNRSVPKNFQVKFK